MTDKPENPRAFPNSRARCPSGMTLRDYFAGQALAGIAMDGEMPSAEWAASWSYALADAMLKESSK